MPQTCVHALRRYMLGIAMHRSCLRDKIRLLIRIRFGFGVCLLQFTLLLNKITCVERRDWYVYRTRNRGDSEREKTNTAEGSHPNHHRDTHDHTTAAPTRGKFTNARACHAIGGRAARSRSHDKHLPVRPDHAGVPNTNAAYAYVALCSACIVASSPLTDSDPYVPTRPLCMRLRNQPRPGWAPCHGTHRLDNSSASAVAMPSSRGYIRRQTAPVHACGAVVASVGDGLLARLT